MTVYSQQDINEILIAQGTHNPIFGEIYGRYLDIMRTHLNIKTKYDLNNMFELRNLLDEITNITEIIFPRYVAASITLKEITEDEVKLHIVEAPFFIYNILNEKSQSIELTPKGFNGKLYPPQAKLLYRMLFFENNPDMKLCNFIINSNTGIVSERTGFGKSFSIPALICKQLIPNFVRKESKVRLGPSHINKDDNTIHTNLIFCTPKTVKQWILNCQNNTNLTSVRVETALDLKNLKLKVDSKNFPHILICKIGKINGKDTVNEMNTIFAGKNFARVIFDDFDMLRLDTNSLFPPALFYWMISSTRNLEKFQYKEENNERNSFFKFFSQSFRLLVICHNIRCDKDYANLDFDVPKIDYYSNMKHHLENQTNELIDEDYLDYEESFGKELANKLVTDIIEFAKDTCSFYPIKEIEGMNLIQGKHNIPFDSDKNPKKILIYSPNQKNRTMLEKCLIEKDIQPMMLKRNNFDIFKITKSTFAITPLISGVNMEYITHIIIFDEDDKQSINQIIGRGQRIGRKCNLQVLLWNLFL